MSLTSNIEITEKGFYTFLKISVRLTGFGANELLATGMLETYYYTIMKEPEQETVRAFFNEAQFILDENAGNEERLNAAIGGALIPDELYDGLARRIILLWYTGMWTSIEIVDGKPVPTSQMVSEKSYMEGLIWTAANTHPAGAKQPGYASWENPPYNITN